MEGDMAMHVAMGTHAPPCTQRAVSQPYALQAIHAPPQTKVNMARSVGRLSTGIFGIRGFPQSAPIHIRIYTLLAPPPAILASYSSRRRRSAERASACLRFRPAACSSL